MPQYLRALVRQISKAIELPRVRLHDLRHLYASLMLENGVDLKTVSTALGHSTIRVTADTYAHISPAMLQSAAASLDQAFPCDGLARRGGPFVARSHHYFCGRVSHSSTPYALRAPSDLHFHEGIDRAHGGEGGSRTHMIASAAFEAAASAIPHFPGG